MMFIHAYETTDRIPSELEANSKILDEAFPAMTIDLVFLKGSFCPTVRVIALEIMSLMLTHITLSSRTPYAESLTFP